MSEPPAQVKDIEAPIETEPTIEDRIEEMRPNSKDGKIVAFIGDSGCVVKQLFLHY